MSLTNLFYCISALHSAVNPLYYKNQGADAGRQLSVAGLLATVSCMQRKIINMIIYRLQYSAGMYLTHNGTLSGALDLQILASTPHNNQQNMGVRHKYFYNLMLSSGDFMEVQICERRFYSLTLYLPHLKSC